MLAFKMNLKRKENKRKEKENRKLSKLWLLSLIQSLRIKNNRLGFKIKKCSNILKINLKNKNKMNNVEQENKNNKKNRWDSTLLNKSKRKKLNKFKRRKLTKNKPKFGKKTLKTFSIMRRIKLIIWRMSTNNMNQFWRNKWKKSKIRKTERKWTLWSFFTIKP